MRQSVDYYGSPDEADGTVETWVAPSNVFEIRPRLAGGWGDTGEASGSVTVTGDNPSQGHIIESWATGIRPNDTLYIRVGGFSTDGTAAWPDGGAGVTASLSGLTVQSGAGGGSSSIRINDDTRDAAIVVAAGGSGAPVYAASAAECYSLAQAVPGGYTDGIDGANATGCATTDAIGGAGGASSCGTGEPPESGVSQTLSGTIEMAAATGGAGGGWCGGDTGEIQASTDATQVNVSGAGSGSSYIGGLSTVTFHQNQQADRTEPRGGYVEIVWAYTEVTNLSVTSASPDEVSLSWEGWAYGEYEIYRHDQSTNVVQDGVLVGTTDASTTSELDGAPTEFTDTTVTDAINYYQVVPKSATGDTGSVSGVVESVADPDTPTITSHDSWTSAVSLYWTEISGATEYRIYMNSEESADFADYSHVATSTEGDLTETISNLQTGYYYHFRITSYDGASESAPSANYRAGTRFEAPTSFSVDGVSGTEIDVSMTNNAAGGEGFRFYKAIADEHVTNGYVEASNPIVADMAASETLSPGTTISFEIEPDQIGSADHWYHPGLASNPASSNDYYQEFITLYNAATTTGAVTAGQNVDLGIHLEDADNTHYNTPTTTTIEVGTKHTVTIVIEEDESVSFYLDDTDLGEDYSGTFYSFPISKLFRGYGDDTTHRGFTGRVYNIDVIDAAMTADDVSAYVNDGHLDYTRLLHYPFDDGSGTTISDTVSNNDATIDGVEGTDFLWGETTTIYDQGDWILDGTAPMVGESEQVTYTTQTTDRDGQKYFLRGAVYTSDREVFNE